MNKKIVIFSILVAMLFITLNFISCKKSDAGTTASNNPPTNPIDTNTNNVPPVDSCALKPIVITATPTGVTPCGANGSIVVSATGSTGFSYKIGSAGTYQASGNFANINAGTYIIYAKDAAGCERDTSVTVAAGGAAGPLFTNVENLISAKCESCHNTNLQNGGMNFDVPCNIVANSADINEQAVILGAMPFGGPQLSTTEKAIITNWINAGGGYTN
jgi:hypothetical protein